MSEQRFAVLQHQLLQLYNQKAYPQALDLLQREAALFPQPAIMYHWKMCLAARANDPAQAIQALREALAQGYSYSAALVPNDDDLQSLQRLPDYEQLVRLSEQRFAEIQNNAKPELLVISPADEHIQHPPLLFGLHGNSQNARVAANDWQILHEKGWLLALAQSSEMMAADAYMWRDFARGTADAQEAFSKLTANNALDTERIVLGGFSAGGGLAIQLAVTGAIQARGFIVIGPYLPNAESLMPFLETAAARGVRGYIVMGLEEPPEDQERIRQTAALLRDHGILCEVEEHQSLAHEFPPSFEQTLEKALPFILQPN